MNNRINVYINTKTHSSLHSPVQTQHRQQKMQSVASKMSKRETKNTKNCNMTIPSISIKRAFRRAGGIRLDARCQPVFVALLEKFGTDFVTKAAHCSLKKTIRYEDGMHALKVGGKRLYGIV